MRTEIRAVASIALLYALRLFGVFLILPVFAIYLMTLPGYTHLLGGLAFGIYGIAQAVMQIPMGWFSDQIGRKPVIAIGLVLFGTGSFLCANAMHIETIIWGRLLQGIGAYGSVVTVMLPDFVAPERRPVVTAGIGILIGIVFSLSFVLGPVFNHLIGVPGIFALMGFLVIVALFLLYTLMPQEPVRHITAPSRNLWSSLKTVLGMRSLRMHTVGIFILHMNFASFWLVLPPHLRELGLLSSQDWQVYLPIMVVSFLFSATAARFIRNERYRYKLALLASILFLFSFSCLMLFYENLPCLIFAILPFFLSLMFFESFFPSLVFSHAPLPVRGTAVSLFSSAQFLGIFAGSVLSALIMQFASALYVFAVSACLFLAWCMRVAPFYQEIFSMPDRGDQWRSQS